MTKKAEYALYTGLLTKVAGIRKRAARENHATGNAVREGIGTVLTPGIAMRLLANGGMPGVVAAASIPLAGMIAAGATKTRSRAEQRAHDSSRRYRSYVPGVGIYDLCKRIGSTRNQ